MLNRFRWSTMFAAVSLVVGTLVACSSSSSDEGESSPEAGFCDALSSAYARCGGTSSCSTAMTADCTKLASVLSPSVLDGARSCVQAKACGSDPLTCLGTALGSAKTSAAALFGTASVPGLGFALLPFGDAPLDAIDAACTKSPLGKSACQAAFSTCLTATTTKFLATSISADSAKRLIEGIKDGLASVGRDSGDAPFTPSHVPSRRPAWR